MKETKKFTPALGYKWLTNFYDLAIKCTMPEKKFRIKLIDLIKPQTNEFILEFGYGTGQNILLAHQWNRKASLYGVDIDPEVKKIAMQKMKNLNANITLDLYDGTRFPYEDHFFDKVFSSLVFHQLDKETKLLCLKEIHRVLKPGGQLTIGDWGKATTSLMRIAFFVVQIFDGFKTTEDNVKGRLPAYLEKAGFRKAREVDFINTMIGTYSYYTAKK